MIMLPHLTPRSKRELGNPELVLSVNLSEETGKRRLELDLRNQAFCIDLYRAAWGLRYRFVRIYRQGDQRQRPEHLQDVSPVLFVAGHKDLLLGSTVATELIAHAPPGG